MPYKQGNNPFKKLHEGLQSFGEKHSTWKAKKAAERQARLEKTGRPMARKYTSTQREYQKGAKQGESKFKFDIRMRKEGMFDSPKSKPSYQAPDPKTEIKGLNIKPSWEYKTQERNPGDLRAPVTTNFGITDEMSFDEAFKQAKLGGIEPGASFDWRGDPYKFEYKESSEEEPPPDLGFWQGDPTKPNYGTMYRKKI